MVDLKKQIEQVKSAMAASEGRESESPAPKEAKTMAKTKKVVKKKVTKVGKKATEGNGAEKKARKPQEVAEGSVSLAQLADEAKITPQSARVRLRSSDIDRPEGRWVWKEDSKALKEARKVLGLS